MAQGNGKDKKPKTAVALEYDPNDEAPRIIATGKGVLAEKIIEKAKEANVPLHQDNELANTLSRLSSMRSWRRYWCLWMRWIRFGRR